MEVMVGAARGVKLVVEVTLTPPTVTVIGPAVAVGGTVAVRVLAVAAVTVAATPLNFTVLLDVVVLKPDPTMVTEAPGAPEAGLKLRREREPLAAPRLIWIMLPAGS